MKVIVAGSRKLNSQKHKEVIHQTLDALEHITLIIHGNARGPDTFGKTWAIKNDIGHRPCLPKWKDIDVQGAVIRENRYGKYNALAGHWRNEEMAKAGDMLIALWDGKSGGTRDMIDRALNHALDVRVIIAS